MPSAAEACTRHPRATGAELPAAAAPSGHGPALALLAGGARRLMLAGHPQAAAPPAGPTPVHRPKEVLLALAAALAEAEGLGVLRANPHFAPVADWDGELAVAHFAALDLACPVPRAHNALVLDGEDLLALAEERRAEEMAGLRRRRVMLMDSTLLAAPPALGAELLPGGCLAPVPVEALLATAAGPEPARTGSARPRPVQWMTCDLETGPYNFLDLKRHARLGSSQARVLLDPALRGGAPALLGFATPGTLAEFGPVLRAVAALQGTAPQGAAPPAGPLFFLFFFGSPEEFSAALAARPQALFFGDNFRCPAIRILFAPFAAAEVLHAIRLAEATIDCCHGGVLDLLAAGMGVARRVMLGPDGSFDAEGAAGPLARGIAWEAVLRPGTLARRRHTPHRANERALAEALEAMLRGP